MSTKILHIISSLKLGGAQVCVKYLVENTGPGDVENFVYPLRCREIDIPIDGVVIKLPWRNYNPRKFFAILKLCRKYDIDIIHAHLEKPILGSLLATFFCKVPVIIHEHGPVFRSGWKHTIYRVGLRFLGNRAAAVIAVSNATADCLVKRVGLNRNRICVIHNAVDLDRFQPDELKRRQIREKLSIAADDIVIGFAGRLSLVKGADLLIEAFNSLAKKSERFVLVIAGDGEERKKLEARTENLGIIEKVRFLGFVDNIAEVINAFDIAVVPSRQEPFGIVALEFMSMRIPLVSSNVDGLAEFITDGETALVPSANMPEEICRCIERLSTNKRLRSSLAEAGYRFCSKFGIEQYVGTFRKIYSEVYKG